jgi:hypothetical protein
METSPSLPLLDLLVCNPWRPPNAWWLRAKGIVDDGAPWASCNRDTCQGKGWIKRTERYLLALRQAKTYDQHVQVVVDFNAIYWAHRIHEATDNLRIRRSGIEARILARETNDQIARKTGYSADTIAAFEALFFNVRDRLGRRDFIMNGVLGQAAVHGLHARDHDLLWKIVGYKAGPHVLDAMIGHIPNPMWASRAEDVPAFFQDTAINLMKMKAAMATLTVPVESHTQLNLIEAFVKYVEIERTTESAGSASDQIQEGLQQMLESMPYATIGVVNAKQLPEFDKNAAELRSDELMLASVGYKIPGIELLQNLKFPEPLVKP